MTKGKYGTSMIILRRTRTFKELLAEHDAWKKKMKIHHAKHGEVKFFSKEEMSKLQEEYND